MIAIALVLEGWSRDAAAEAGAMDRQTLCDWVHRYNELGLAGLFDRPRRNGPPPRLSAEQQATLAAWVEQGPAFVRMAWYVGAVSICSDELRRSLRCSCTSTRWVNPDFSYAGSASGLRIWEKRCAATVSPRSEVCPDADRVYGEAIRI
jgi:hypothetical protein